MTFEELELDSLAPAELGAQLEEDRGVTVDEENLTSTTTVADIAALLEVQGAVVPAREAPLSRDFAAGASGERGELVVGDRSSPPALDD